MRCSFLAGGRGLVNMPRLQRHGFPGWSRRFRPSHGLPDFCTHMTLSRLAATLCLLELGFSGYALCAAAQPTAISTPAPGATGILTGNLAQGSAYDQLWSTALLYKNKDNPLLQELAVQGQLQVQYARGSSEAGQYGSGDMPDCGNWGDVEVRRFRLGMRALMFNQFKFHSLFDINPELEPQGYKDIAEAYLTWAPADAFNISLGKTELKFTREQEVSSREILPFERSQLVNLFYGGELTGLWVAGKGIADGWLYELGAYGNDRRDEFTHLEGGTMILAKIGYDFTKLTSFDVARVELHYLHNTEPGYRSPGYELCSPNFSDCLALSNDLTKGRFSLATECFWGDGANGRSDVLGITCMPAWYLSDKLQLVTTFQFAGSDGSTGIPLPLRYEGLVPGVVDRAGDSYFAGYAGLNYYFYGHKLKVMSGVKYTSLSGGPTGDDFSGWTWLAGMRMSF